MIPGVNEWLILLLVVVLVFGTKKLRNIGSDLGSAVKGFKKSMTEEESGAEELKPTDRIKNDASSGQVFDIKTEEHAKEQTNNKHV